MIVADYEKALPPGAWPNWVLGNHDEPRVASRVGAQAARAAMMLLLTLRGTPTLYYGDELGLPDVPVPPELMHDPQGRQDPALSRDPQRSPMPWSPGPGHGFTAPGAVPWLPVASDADDLSVRRQAGDPRSMLSLTRALLAARRASPALASGDWTLEPAPGGVLAYRRRAGDDERLVLLNIAAEPRAVALTGRWEVEVATGERRGRLDAEVALDPSEGLLLRPA
jgi:alpha-glucosidase